MGVAVGRRPTFKNDEDSDVCFAGGVVCVSTQ